VGHIPSKVEYGLQQIYQDLFQFAAQNLKRGGRLVCWIPIVRWENHLQEWLIFCWWKIHVSMLGYSSYKVPNVYNVQSEYNYVMLSIIIQLTTACFGHFTWPSSGFVLSLQTTVLHNRCIKWEMRSCLHCSGTWTQLIGWYQYLIFMYCILYSSLSLASCLFTFYWMGW